MDVTAKIWPRRLLLGGGGVAIGAAAAAALVLGSSGPSVAPPANAGAAVAAAPAAAVAPAAAPELATARHALLLRLRNPDAARLSDVAVYRFGPEDERAVCGTVASPEVAGGSARFVVRLVLPRAPAEGMARDAAGQRPPLAIVEDGPGVLRPAPDAARRYCRDAAPVVAGGAGTRAGGAAPPSGAPAEGGGPSAAAAPAWSRPRMIVQSAVNLRTGPGGAVISVVPRGRTLEVFERAPGGWVRVAEAGAAEAAGWVHTSLLAEAPTTLSAATRP